MQGAGLWVAVHGGGAAVHAGGVGVRRGGAVVAGGGATACKGGAACGCVGHAGCGCARAAGCVHVGSLAAVAPSRTVAAPEPPASAPGVGEGAASCTCDAAGSCGCAHNESERDQSQDGEHVDKALLEHTQRLTAWWLAQSGGSTHDTQLWSGPLPSPAADSIDL